MVSIIIPNYNHAKYLDQRLESVLNQTFQDFEVIILDDCSADNSREVIDKYRGHDKIAHIVYNEQNSGSTFKQWDKGFALANGEYIWIAESDDMAELDFLETTVPVLNSDSTIAYVSTNSNFIDKDNYVFQRGIGNAKYVKEKSCFDITKSTVDIYDGLDFVKKHLFYYNYISNASGVVFRLVNALSLPSDFKNYRLNGDWLFWLELSHSNKVAIVNSVHNNFRFHNNNARTNTSINLAISEILNLQKAAKVRFDLSDEYTRKALFYCFKFYSVSVNYNIVAIKQIFNSTLLKKAPNLKLYIFYYKYIYHSSRKLYFILKGICSKLI